jgi:ankyrin repeat protein
MITVQHANPQGFELVLLAGANPLLPDPCGLNLLHVIAANERSTPCLTVLIRYPENAVHALMDGIDNDGDTPCHTAAKRGNSVFIEALLQIGKFPTMIKNGEGKSPLDVANDEIRRFLMTPNLIPSIDKTPMKDPDYSSDDAIQRFVAQEMVSDQHMVVF